jgi:hypothetical protein
LFVFNSAKPAELKTNKKCINSNNSIHSLTKNCILLNQIEYFFIELAGPTQRECGQAFDTSENIIQPIFQQDLRISHRPLSGNILFRSFPFAFFPREALKLIIFEQLRQLFGKMHLQNLRASQIHHFCNIFIHSYCGSNRRYTCCHILQEFI